MAITPGRLPTARTLDELSVRLSKIEGLLVPMLVRPTPFQNRGIGVPWIGARSPELELSAIGVSGLERAALTFAQTAVIFTRNPGGADKVLDAVFGGVRIVAADMMTGSSRPAHFLVVYVVAGHVIGKSLQRIIRSVRRSLEGTPTILDALDEDRGVMRGPE